MDTTRRALLATVGGSVTLGLAGCLGSTGNGGSDGADGAGGSGNSNSSGGSGDCEITEESKVQELPAPTKGPDDAPVTVKVWKDYVCPHCATFTLDILPKIESNFIESGDVKYEHHDLPLPMSEWSWTVPNAARGVQESMDDETFFEFSHTMFANQGKYSLDFIQNKAEEVGADGCAIRGDAVNETYRPVLEADKQRALDRGAEGTPAVYVNGTLVKPTWEEVKAAIEAEH
jgi:protein-disulfide isomerase